MLGLIAGVKFHFFGLLLDAWDKGLVPGVFENYPQDFSGARNLINDLHGRIMDQSWGLFGALFAVGALLGLAGQTARLKITPDKMVMMGVLVAVLLSGYDGVFGTIMATGDDLSQEIASREKLMEATQQIQEAARNISSGESEDSDTPYLLKLFGQILFALAGPGLLTGLVIGLSICVMLIGSLFINTLWVIFTVVLYTFGPLVIVLGLIPGWGPKILTNWFGALIQLSAWQIWMAICWWCVEVGSQLPFLMNNGELPTIDNLKGHVTSFEGAAFALVFALLYLATPFIVQGILPLSRFSVMAGIGMAAAHSQVSSVVNKGRSGGQGSGGGGGNSFGGGGSGGGGGAAGGGGGGGGKTGMGGGGGGAAGGGGGAAAGGGGGAAAGAGAAAGPAAVAAVGVQAGVAAVQKVNDGIRDQAQNMGDGGGGAGGGGGGTQGLGGGTQNIGGGRNTQGLDGATRPLDS